MRRRQGTTGMTQDFKLLVMVLSVGCHGDPKLQPDAPPPPPPDAALATWTPCYQSFDCATIDVPVDYTASGGPTIGMRLIRAKARSNRLGSLVINTGGPGA